jgi:DNA-binding winged helix-turn-helix (wHTH) protein
MSAAPRYRFHDFVLSPRRRLLLRAGREQALIPRYFDLLVFLVQHRHEAVHRRDIFDRVWSDVVVSDSALSQAVRTIRRTLGDDSREPRYIATVSRHGYRFVCMDVVEEPDDDGAAATAASQGLVAARPIEPAALPAQPDPFEPLLAVVASVPMSAGEEDQQREAAELLHTLGTAEALRRLGTRTHHAAARAALRDTRWETPGAGPVPILGAPSPVATARALVTLRLRRAARVAAGRWAGASAGAGAAGAVGGAVGGLLLSLAPSSSAPLAVVPVLAVLGGGCGGFGGAGVGAGLAIGETIARSRRTLVLPISGAIGGGLAGLAAQWLGRWGLAALVGLHVDIGGGLDGLALGAAAGLGYAAATGPTLGGLPTPHGRERWSAAGAVALACGLAALGLTLAGRPLVGGTLHAIASAAQGSQMLLTPVARLIGEPDFGPVTSALIGTGEGALFGAGLALGLTRRPRT